MSTVLSELKTRHRAIWACGDYPSMVERFLLPLGAWSAPPASAPACASSTSRPVPATPRSPPRPAGPRTAATRSRGRAARASCRLELDWVEADAEDLPFDDGSFDV